MVGSAMSGWMGTWLLLGLCGCGAPEGVSGSVPLPSGSAASTFPPPTSSSSPIGSGSATTSAPELTPEQECDKETGARSKLQAWPTAAAAELASRGKVGGFNVQGTITALVPHYDCGGSRIDCKDAHPMELTFQGDDHTTLTIHGGYDNDHLQDLLVGHRYTLSLAACPLSKGGHAHATLKGYEVPNRTEGAAVACDAPHGFSSAALEAWPVRDLPLLRRDLVKPGGFNTEGVVVSHFVPKGCPTPHSPCKPEPPPYLVLAERARDPEHTMVLVVDKPTTFPVGTKWRVSVVVCGQRNYGASTVNQGYLVAALRK